MTKQQLKLIQSLQHKKFRKIHGLFIVEGLKMVHELLRSRFDVKHILVSQSWKAENPGFDFGNNTAEVISEKDFKPLSNFTTPPGILAVAQIPETSTGAIKIDGLTLVLDGISDPGNMGTIIRTAEWFGVKAIVCSADATDVWQPKVVQATMGSVFRIPVFQADLPLFFNAIEKSIPVYGALLEGNNLYLEKFNRQKPALLVIGSESHGIRETVMPFITNPLTIPAHSSSEAESLNASVATAIMLSRMLGSGRD